MSEGVTTIEVKSGYGLDRPGSAACSKWPVRSGRDLPVSIETTFLGLHALPAEFRDAAPGVRRTP